MAFDRLGTTDGIMYWTDPPAGGGDYGDSHRTINPQLIHVTALAWSGGNYEELARTVIHEASHLLGFNHPDAYLYEDSCM
jgi:hypothetical protein